MADLANFNLPDNASNEQDFIDTLRANAVRAATLDHTAAANKVVGTINLSGAGASDRAIGQWNGTTNVGFTLGSLAFKSSLYATNRGSTSVQQSADGLILNFGNNRYLELNDTANELRYVVDGVQRISSARATSRVLRLQSAAGETQPLFEIVAGAASASQAVEASYIISNELGQIKQFVKNYINTDGSTAFEFWGTPSGSPRNAINGNPLAFLRPGAAAGAARLTIGDVVDDGVSALQAKSLRLADQPKLFLYRPFQSMSASVQNTFICNNAYGGAAGITYNFSTGVITVARAMTLELVASLIYTSNSASDSGNFYVEINGSTAGFFNNLQQYAKSNAGNFASSTLVFNLVLNAGDQVRLLCFPAGTNIIFYNMSMQLYSKG